jgi:hypothetical protein
MKTLGARVSTYSFPKSNKDTNSRLGNYEILEEIAQNRMGVISLSPVHFGRIVAVKRVLGYHGDSHETLARLPLRNSNGRKPGSSQHPALEQTGFAFFRAVVPVTI